MAKLFAFWDGLDEHAKTIVTALVLAVVLALTAFVLSPKPSPIENPTEVALRTAHEENLILRQQLQEASRSVESHRVEKQELVEELERARKNVKVVVREVFRPDGKIQERVTETKTNETSEKTKKVDVKAATQSVKVVEVVKIATVSVDVSQKTLDELKLSYETRTSFGLGAAVMPTGIAFVASYSPVKLGPFALDVLVGSPIPFRPLAGVGASAEVFPRFALGAAAMLDPFALSVSPGLTLTHRF